MHESHWELENVEGGYCAPWLDWIHSSNKLFEKLWPTYEDCAINEDNHKDDKNPKNEDDLKTTSKMKTASKSKWTSNTASKSKIPQTSNTSDSLKIGEDVISKTIPGPSLYDPSGTVWPLFFAIF